MAIMFTFRKYNNNLTNEHNQAMKMIIGENGFETTTYNSFFTGHNFDEIYWATVCMTQENFNDDDRLCWFQVDDGKLCDGVHFAVFGTTNAIQQFNKVLASKRVILNMPAGEVLWSSKKV